MSTKTYALTTKERVKTRLSLTTTDFDDAIVGMIYAATDMIEKYTGRRFERATYTNVIFDGLNYGKASDFLLLPHAPIVSVASFEYNSGTISSPTWNAMNADSYFVDSVLDGIQMVSSVLPRGQRNLRVTYTGGYLIDFDNYTDDAQHTLPMDISDLAERIAIRLFNKRETEGQSTSNFGESNITWHDILKAEDKALLNEYKRDNGMGV